MTPNTNSKGFTLLEVFVSVLICSVLAGGFSLALQNAARRRSQARLREAALIEACSYMEKVIARINDSEYISGNSGYIDENIEETDVREDISWMYDGVEHLVEISYSMDGHILSFTVSVDCGDRPVYLFSEAYLE